MTKQIHNINSSALIKHILLLLINIIQESNAFIIINPSSPIITTLPHKRREHHPTSKNIQPNIPPTFTKKTLNTNFGIVLKSSSEPNDSEIIQQQKETLESLEDYHNGSWKGYAKSFGISNKNDISAAAGGMISDYQESSEYTTSIQIIHNDKYGGGGKESSVGKIQETISWQQQGKNGNEDQLKVAIRSLELAESMDVDAVDSSYSCDISSIDNGDIPSILSGSTNTAALTFGIEQCLVTSEKDRIRCFVLYDDKDTLSRVVICHESRITDGNEEELVKLNRMEQLQQQTATTNAKGEEEVVQNLVPHPITIFGLVSGTWLGDVIIRNHPTTTPSTSSLQPQGFAKKINTYIFAKWSLGVQKLAMTFTMSGLDNKSTNIIRQRYDLGRYIGSTLQTTDFPTLSIGTFSRNKKHKLTCIDFEMGTYLGFLIGSTFIKIPRIKSFEYQSNYFTPFYTEFAIFQKNQQELSAMDGSSTDIDAYIQNTELSCSKLSRLYDKDGHLCQAASAFFVLNRSSSSSDSSTGTP